MPKKRKGRNVRTKAKAQNFDIDGFCRFLIIWPLIAIAVVAAFHGVSKMRNMTLPVNDNPSYASIVNIEVRPSKGFSIEDTVYFSIETLRYYGVKFPEVAYFQCKLETSFCANEKSLCYPGNKDCAWNLFGMKVPYKRPSTAIGSVNGFCKYRNWQDSVRDYVLWQQMYKNHIDKMNNPLDYIDLLIQKKYCTQSDTDYYGDLRKLVKQYLKGKEFKKIIFV